MLDSDTIQKIEQFVAEKPRNVQEIAELVDRSWKTADRYVKEIEENYGTIAMRTFREGTRGALKVVYWAGMNERAGTVFQQRLAEQIKNRNNKHNFSAFDIYQHVPDEKKKATVDRATDEGDTNLSELGDFMTASEDQLLIFSGDLSFLNLENNETAIYDCIEELVERDVSIKVLCRVDLVSYENVQKMLELNFKHGKECIEIRHREQPVRGFVSDSKRLRLKEIKEPTGDISDLNQKVFLFYTIKDTEWSEWMAKNFWNMFSESISSDKRIEEIQKLKPQ